MTDVHSDEPDDVHGEDLVPDITAHVSRRALFVRLGFLAVTAGILYGFLPQLTDIFSQVPELADVDHRYFIAMVVLETLSFVCMWALWRIALPKLRWRLAATAQLSSNAVSRIVPGGGAVGAASGFHMLSNAGIDRSRAAAALAANSIISNGVLFALPLIALIWSLVGVKVPEQLEIGAWIGASLFVVLFGFGFVLVRYDRPIHAFGRFVGTITGFAARRLHHDHHPDEASVVAARDQLIGDLGPRWKHALAAAAGNWVFDYLTLVVALLAVGAHPRPSLVLLAYTGAAILAMIPLTPGGLGFVEAGLTSMLVVAHVKPERALLATLAYRLVSYWLPLAFGLAAYVAYRRRQRV